MGTHPIFESVFDCLTEKVKPIEIREKMESMKLILCGDSAVGKSKLVERFLLDDYSKHTSSTYAITKYIQNIKIDGLGTVKVDLWDTAGQYFRNDSCHFTLVFIITPTQQFWFLMLPGSQRTKTYQSGTKNSDNIDRKYPLSY